MQKTKQKGPALRLRSGRPGAWKYLIVLIPILAFWFVLHIYPNIAIFGTAFYKWSGLSDAKKFVGWQNFKVAFRSEQWFKKCFFNTSVYIVYSVVL